MVEILPPLEKGRGGNGHQYSSQCNGYKQLDQCKTAAVKTPVVFSFSRHRFLSKNRLPLVHSQIFADATIQM